jgi:hypothetical protein
MGLFAAPYNDGDGLSRLWSRNLGSDESSEPSVADLDPNELLWLARTMQAEADNQGYEGMIDVGSVIKNRVDNGAYGKGILGTIFKPGQFSSLNSITGYAGGEQGQDMNFQPKQEAMMAAKAILTGDYEDRTGGATHYYANIPGVSDEPKWAKGKEQTKIGDHYFLQADAGRVGPTKEAARAQEAGPLGSFADRARGNTDQLNRALMAREESPLNQAVKKSEGKLGFADRGNTSPTLPGTNQPMIKGPAFNPAAKAAPAAGTAAAPAAAPNEVASTKSEATEEEKEPTLMQKVGGWLDKERGGNKTMRDRINALGVGLGQMSHGQPVDLSSFFQGVQQQRQAVVEQKQAAAEAEQRMALDQIKQQTAMQNANTSAQNAAIATAKFAHEIDAGNMSTEAYSTIGQAHPQLKQLAALAQLGDTAAQKELASRLSEQAAASLPNTAEQAALASYVNAKDDAGRLAALDGLSPEGMKRVTQLGGQIVSDDPDMHSAIELGRQLYDQFPGMYGSPEEAMEEALAAEAGIPSDNREERKFNQEIGRETYDRLYKSYAKARSLQPAINNMLVATDELLKAGVSTSSIDSKLASSASALLGLASRVGGASSAKEVVEKYLGAPLENFEKLHASEKILAFEFARLALEGQGSVSDQERMDALRTVVNGNTTAEERLNAIGRMRASFVTDQLAYEYFAENRGEAMSNAVNATEFVELELGQMAGPLSTAMSERMRTERAGSDMLNDKARTDLIRKAMSGDEAAENELLMMESPHLTSAQARANPETLAKHFDFYYDIDRAELVSLEPYK